MHCDICGHDRVVAFSCKGRSVCSSCCGRRMADTAAHLVDRVLPDVPIRQWELYGASVQGRVATGSKAGERIATLGFEEEFEGKKEGRRCANLSGFSLHANVAIPAKARHQLEMLCRYVARPPVAMERLSKLPDGRVIYQLRHRWRNGATHMIFEPLDLIGKLAALVPPPRFNLIRYYVEHRFMWS